MEKKVKENLEAMLEYSPDSIVQIDRDGRFMLVNRKAAEIMKVKEEEILGKTNRELGMPEPLCRQLEEDLRQLKKEKKQVVRTFQFDDQYYEAKCVPELDESGEVKTVFIFTRDVDHHEEKQQDLASQLKYARDLIKAVQEPILVLDDQIRVRSSNAVFRDKFQLEDEELVDRPLEDITQILKTNVKNLRQKLQQLIKENVESRAEIEVEVELPDEGNRLMLCHASQIDHMPLILFSMRDITDHRHQISNLEKDLRKRNRELTLSYKKLKQLLVELSETEDRERTNLAELLHDDLQQILVALGFQLKVLGEETPEGEYIDRILKQADSLVRRSVRMTRDLSRELSPHGPRGAHIEDSLQYIADQMKELHGLQVEVDVKGDVQTTDSTLQTLLVKAIKEMLLNIVKHADVREANLEVGRQEDLLYVWVRDHGRGFNPDEVLSKPGGGGLGLFSIRERLHALGGKLEVDSAEGRGSRFRLEIPLEDSIPISPQEESEVEKAVLEGVDGVVRLVLVDDHTTMRQALAAYLDQHPRLQVVGQAADGKEGVKVVTESQPDVVLMDLAMPKLNGAEATREIKSRFPDIRVVGLSLFPDDGLAEHLKKFGMDAFLQKTALLSEVCGEVIPENSPAAP